MSVDTHLDPTVRVVSVLVVSAMRGDGSNEDPERLCYFYYDLEGRLLAAHDPVNGDPGWYFIPPLPGTVRHPPRAVDGG